MSRAEHSAHVELSLGQHPKEPHSNKSNFAVNGQLPKGDFKFRKFNLVGARHGEGDWAQMSDLRLIERLAGFGPMEQGFELCFEGKKLFGPRPLIEPVDERVYANEHQRTSNFGMEIDR